MACENFITHIKNGYYDGVLFHRIIANFMIQGGDPTGTGRGGESIWGKHSRTNVPRHTHLTVRACLPWRMLDPELTGANFFITTTATPWLNMNHTIFGEVVSGMETVKALESVEKVLVIAPYRIKKLSAALL